jgi:transcriptional regulator with XRE-family HTH domain
MDEKWFKDQQRKAGITAEDIARRMGRDRSTVSHIYTGRIRMSFDWAKAFAEAFGVSVGEILARAGIADSADVRELSPGFSDGDAALWVPKAGHDRQMLEVASALGAKAGVDVWRVRNKALSQSGYLPDDFVLVDSHKSEHVKAGDVVLAQIYNNVLGTAMTVLRLFLPPVLVSFPEAGEVPSVNVVDGVNVVIRGKVMASWREN